MPAAPACLPCLCESPARVGEPEYSITSMKLILVLALAVLGTHCAPTLYSEEDYSYGTSSVRSRAAVDVQMAVDALVHLCKGG